MPRYGSSTTARASGAADYPRQARDGDTRRLTRAEEELRIGKRTLVIAVVVIGLLWWFLSNRGPTATNGQLTAPDHAVAVSASPLIAA
jgi:hypothetical protein